MQVKNNGHTVVTKLAEVPGGDDEEDPKNSFTSQIAKTEFGVQTPTFKATQFYFHSGSQHTIDGHRFDLEMETTHVLTEVDNGFVAGAVGILFDTTFHNAVLTPQQVKLIDNFFNDLKFDSDNPTPDEIRYGDLMKLVDVENRWVYQGSTTTPPCSTKVYWNVVQTVYPIK